MAGHEPILLFGKVTDTKDPDSLGRVQVQIDGFGQPITLPWLRILQLGHGIFLPEKDTEVAILRGSGNAVDGMLILGCVWSADKKPEVPDSDGKNDTKSIKTRSGNEITLLDKSGSETITIKTGDGKLSILFDKAGGKVEILADKELMIKSNTKATVQAQEVIVKGDSKVTIDGATEVALKSSAQVKIEGSAGVKISGAMVEIG